MNQVNPQSNDLATFGEAMRQKLNDLRYPEGHNRLAWFKIYPLPIIGCDVDEINEIKAVQAVTHLPEIYMEFLKHMGKFCGDTFIGCDLIYYYLSRYSFKKLANRILSKDKRNLLRDDDYVFMNIQGHSFWYFPIDQGDDPSVFGYQLDDGENDPDYLCRNGPIMISPHLSEYLTSFIAERESKEAQDKFLNTYARNYS